MDYLAYIRHYPDHVIDQVKGLVEQNKLSGYLSNKYPDNHNVTSEKALYNYLQDLKKRYIKQSLPITSVRYDPKMKVINQALGTHAFISRVQGSKLKSKNEIRISTHFKHAPHAMLEMIVVHELAHLKEKSHDKAFYKLCCHMQPDYHQVEFDTRLYLLNKELLGN